MENVASLAVGGPAPEIKQTHVSWVILIGDTAYKIKRPVRFPFVDLSTPALRAQAAQAEVELNRRFAPDVYRGVATMIGIDGEPCDSVVVMRRMPADRSLSHLARTGWDLANPLREIAHVIVAAHARANRSDEIDECGLPSSIEDLWRTNLRELETASGGILPPSIVESLRSLSARFVEGRSLLYMSRVADGKIADLHGDLLADDIFCLDDGPRILDCLEFDERLRYGDVLSDVAFLAMDLEYLGRADEARAFLDAYRRFSGDEYPESLAHNYIAYRASIRAKVACLRAREGDDEAVPEAVGLATLALGHLLRGRVSLTLIGGIPGAGKSALADDLASQTGAVVLRSDEVRKELAGMSHQAHAHAAFREGLYTPERTNGVYHELLARAERLLGMGESVICDASWSRADDRSDAGDLASRTNADLHQIECVAPYEVITSRLRARRKNGGVSDADEDVSAAMAARFDRWDEAERIDTGGPPRAALLAALAAHGAPSPPRRADGLYHSGAETRHSTTRR